MLKIALAAAAITAAFTTAPAQAQSLDQILNLVDGTVTSVDRLASGRGCNSYSGVSKITCRTRAVQSLSNRITRFERQRAMARRTEKHRQAVRLNRAGYASKLLLNVCINGEMSACRTLALTPEQAKALLAQNQAQPKINITVDHVAVSDADRQAYAVAGM